MLSNYAYVEKVLKGWLENKVIETNTQGVVLGLSGGIDSAVTSVLANKVFPNNTLGVIMPCYSNDDDKSDAIMMAEKYNIEYKVKSLRKIYDTFKEKVEAKEKDSKSSMALANTKARLRMTTLYYYANQNNYLVLGTGNWSELKIGYFTKYGDGAVDIDLIGRLVKTEVKKLAQYLNIPKKIVNKNPSAGLWEGPVDEKELGVTYQELDKYILGEEISKESKKQIEKLIKLNKHKKGNIPCPNRRMLIS